MISSLVSRELNHSMGIIEEVHDETQSSKKLGMYQSSYIWIPIFEEKRVSSLLSVQFNFILNIELIIFVICNC